MVLTVKEHGGLKSEDFGEAEGEKSRVMSMLPEIVVKEREVVRR